MSSKPTVNIYTEVYAAIAAIIAPLITDGRIKEAHQHPALNLNAYPAVIYFPSSLENDFETTGENFRFIDFVLYVVVGAKQAELNNAFSSYLPKAVDAILEAFDTNWSLDNINGHRVWMKVEGGDWTVSENEPGVEVTAELNIKIKLLTNN